VAGVSGRMKKGSRSVVKVGLSCLYMGLHVKKAEDVPSHNTHVNVEVVQNINSHYSNARFLCEHCCASNNSGGDDSGV